jgi:hypothetical protein
VRPSLLRRVSYRKSVCRSRIHERIVSLRFLAIIYKKFSGLRFLYEFLKP